MQITVDLTSVPNIAAISGAVVAILVTVSLIVTLLVKKLGIVSIGPIRMEQQSQTTMYDMNEKIRDLDDLCRKNMRYITGSIRKSINGLFREYHICTLARIALSAVIQFPLYESVSNNHFTTELMPESYSAYRGRILHAMKDEYAALADASDDSHCEKGALPAWDTISDRLIGCIDDWLTRISREVKSTCDRKIEIYGKFRHIFEESKDKWRAGVVVFCMDKNKHYSTVLGMRLKKE